MIKEDITTRACGADGCFSRENISMAGFKLLFCKGVCIFNSGNSSTRVCFMKEDVGSKVTGSIRTYLVLL